MININLYLVDCILLKERVQEKTKENFRGQPLKNSKRYGLFKQTMPLRISWRLCLTNISCTCVLLKSAATSLTESTTKEFDIFVHRSFF